MAYNLTWSDVHYNPKCHSPAPMRKTVICQAAKAHADHLQSQDWDIPVADEVMPQLDPHWTQPGDPGFRRLQSYDHLPLKECRKYHIHVNYDKLQPTPKGQTKIQLIFLAHFTEAVQKYTNLDVTTPAGFLLPFCSIYRQVSPRH